MACHSFVIVAVVLGLCVDLGQSIVCTDDICARVLCKALKQEECQGPNEVIKLGGLCSCCPQCFTILGENEQCSTIPQIIRGAPPPTNECGEGLICDRGVCRKLSDYVEEQKTEQ